MDNEKKKNSIIQVLRALAIILVLIHHSITNINASAFGKTIDNIIICFHMPIFFLISGYLFESKIKKYIENGKLVFIKNKIKHLIFPYLFWTVLLWVGIQVACVVNKSFMLKIGYDSMNILELLKGIFTYEVYYTQHLWFLYVLFIMFIISIFSIKCNKRVLLCISIICGMSTAIISYPNIITRLFMWFPFFIIGRCIISNIDYIKKWKETFFNNSKKIFIANIYIFLIFIFLCVFRIVLLDNNSIEIKIISKLLMYLIGFSGSYLLYVVAKFICKFKLEKIISKIGDYSYEIYLIHNPYFVAVSSILLSSLKLPSIICLCVSVVLGIVFPILISIIIKKVLKKYSFVVLGK